MVPIMGNIASEKSDYVIFTSDNPRTEDPQKIMDDILSGVTKDNFEVELDRPTAIVKGLKMLKAGDILLILGKGHEDYQIIGHEKQAVVPCSRKGNRGLFPIRVTENGG